jgi:lysozyme family protein
MTNLEQALSFTLKHEGGYVNDPNDPGGETNFGISKRAFPNLDIKNLTLDQVSGIYEKKYWIPAGCQELDLPLAVCVFDTAVNMGVGRALEFLKQTQEPYEYTALRRNYYYDLADRKPTMKKYLNGWLNRVIDLRKFIDVLNNS